MQQVLVDHALLTGLVVRYGSPLRLVFPQVLRDNLRALRAVLDEAGLDHRIYYAHKVNRSSALVRAAAAGGAFLDVASVPELQHVLACGVPADRVEATGPKGERFLAALAGPTALTGSGGAAGGGPVVNVDNPWELDRLTRLAGSVPEQQVPVLLRLSTGGRAGAHGTRVTRFGLTPDQVRPALERLAAGGPLDLLGVAFHLDSGDVAARAGAVEDALAVVEEAYRLGLAPRVLDAGGGLRQAFSADPAAYERYDAALRRGLTGDGPALTWDGATLGYRSTDGTVRGVPVYHKYGNASGGPESLRGLLRHPLPRYGGAPVAQVLQDALLQLWLEPGKALVDHAGVTVATVEFTRLASDGSTVVSLDLSRDTVTPADQEVLLDPVVVPRRAQPPDTSGPAVPVFFAGHLCLERDLVHLHATFLSRLPEPGDLVVFPNTAGYRMDLSAAEPAMHPLPRRLAVTVQAGQADIRPDDPPEGGER